jgi:hypothetical protein
VKVVVVCVECGIVTHTPWPDNTTELRNFARTLWRECRFVLSIVTGGGATTIPMTPGTEIVLKDGVMAPICGDCAKRIHGDVIIERVEQLFGDVPQTKRSGN